MLRMCGHADIVIVRIMSTVRCGRSKTMSLPLGLLSLTDTFLIVLKIIQHINQALVIIQTFWDLFRKSKYSAYLTNNVGLNCVYLRLGMYYQGYCIIRWTPKTKLTKSLIKGFWYVYVGRQRCGLNLETCIHLRANDKWVIIFQDCS